MANFSFKLEGLDEALKSLDQVAVILEQDLEAALRKGAAPVLSRARQLVPRPGQGGYTGGKRETFLYQSLTARVVRYQGLTLLVLGAGWGKGRHAHLVELGHDMVTHDGTIVGDVEPNEFLSPAVDEMKDAALAAVINHLRAATRSKIPGAT